jgi:hypothetical protein
MRHCLAQLDRPITVFAVVVAVLCSSCFQARRGPQPPDLSSERSEVAQTIEKLERIESTMASELDQLEALDREFFDEERSAWARPFPLDAFKHASMSCLNAPYVQNDAEPRVQEAADRLQVSCAVPAALSLEQRLNEVTTRRAFGVRKLRQIDQMRSVRTRLQDRLRQLPSITRRTRNYLASRRAEARKMVEAIERRRPEYLRKDFQEALRRVEQYRERLDALESSIATVERSIPRWSRTLGTVVDRLYKNLSRLGRR